MRATAATCAVGAIEPQFYADLRDKRRLARRRVRPPERSQPLAVAAGEAAAAIFRTSDRDEWAKLLAGTDACAAPVLTFEEAERDPHLAARETFVEHDGGVQPAPAPRFSRTPSAIQHSAGVGTTEVSEILEGWGGKPALRSRA